MRTLIINLALFITISCTAQNVSVPQDYETRQILTMFPDAEVEISSYIKAEKLDLKLEEDVARLLKYFDTLPSEPVFPSYPHGHLVRDNFLSKRKLIVLEYAL